MNGMQAAFRESRLLVNGALTSCFNGIWHCRSASGEALVAFWSGQLTAVCSRLAAPF